MKPRRKNNPGTQSIIIAVIGAFGTVIIALGGTFFVSSHIPNLPTTTSTAAIALSPFKTFIPLTFTAIPAPTSTFTPSPTPLSMPPDSRMQIIEKQYTVMTGDTFDKISNIFFESEDYGEAISRSNCVNILRAGIKLTIKYYIVQKGDDVFDIADRFQINYQRLRFINADENGLVIYPGDYLILPVSNICS